MNCPFPRHCQAMRRFAVIGYQLCPGLKRGNEALDFLIERLGVHQLAGQIAADCEMAGFGIERNRGACRALEKVVCLEHGLVEAFQSFGRRFPKVADKRDRIQFGQVDKGNFETVGLEIAGAVGIELVHEILRE